MLSTCLEYPRKSVGKSFLKKIQLEDPPKNLLRKIEDWSCIGASTVYTSVRCNSI